MEEDWAGFGRKRLMGSRGIARFLAVLTFNFFGCQIMVLPVSNCRSTGRSYSPKECVEL